MRLSTGVTILLLQRLWCSEVEQEMLEGTGQPPKDPGRGRSRSQDRNRHLLREGEKKTAGLYLTIFKSYFSLVDPMAGGRLASSTANIPIPSPPPYSQLTRVDISKGRRNRYSPPPCLLPSLFFNSIFCFNNVMRVTGSQISNASIY